MIDLVDYRVASILPKSRQLLALKEGIEFRLPTVGIHSHCRPAEALTRHIRERWNVGTIVLDILHDAALATPCAVMEIRDESFDSPFAGCIAVTPEAITHDSLGLNERACLRDILDGGDGGNGPFARIGWVEELQAWIRDALMDSAIVFSRETCHLNAGGRFCLIRLATVNDRFYWMKAVGGNNSHEYDITMYLANHCPEYLPPVVAARQDWNAWVMEEVGSSLQNSTSYDEYERAVATLTGLQKRLIDRSGDLLAVRCGDHRPETLSRHIDEVMAYLTEAMASQTSVKAPQLSSARLRSLGEILHHTCHALYAVGIPDSIMHNDISPGSILSDGSHCVLTDWCEAYVGNPFITFEQLCVHLARRTEKWDSWIERLKYVYKAAWIDIVTDKQINRAFQLARLISVFSYLYGHGDWLKSARRNQDYFQSYARSLARHMDRISASPDFLEVLCQSH